MGDIFSINSVKDGSAVAGAIAIAMTVFGFSDSDLKKANNALVTARGGNVNFTLTKDSVPTPGDNNHLLPDGQSINLFGSAIINAKFIRADVTDANMFITLGE